MDLGGDDLAESHRRTQGRSPQTWGHPAGAAESPPVALRGAHRDRSSRPSRWPKGQGDGAHLRLWRTAVERPPAAEPCSLIVRRIRGTVVVTVRGLLDRASGPVLDRLLVDLIDGQGNQTVAVDLLTARVEGVEGMRPLLAAGRSASKRGTRLVLNAPSPALWRELLGEGFTAEFDNAGEYCLPPT